MYQEMIYWLGSNLPNKNFCSPRHIGDFAEILSKVIGRLRNAKHVFFFGRGAGGGKLFFGEHIFTIYGTQVKNCASCPSIACIFGNLLKKS